jgi:methionine synthase I (cobalamin-dependent)
LKKSVAQDDDNEKEFNNFVESMAETAAKNTFGGKRINADSFVQRGKKVDIYKEAARIAVKYVEGD